jgi:hypothetical protein
MSLELAVLTTMITPAVLISACGALILPTSVRLGGSSTGCGPSRIGSRSWPGSSPAKWSCSKSSWGTILLGFEATLALRSVHSEMDFLWKLGTHHAPDPLLERVLSRSIWSQFRPRRTQ